MNQKIIKFLHFILKWSLLIIYMLVKIFLVYGILIASAASNLLLTITIYYDSFSFTNTYSIVLLIMAILFWCWFFVFKKRTKATKENLKMIAKLYKLKIKHLKTSKKATVYPSISGNLNNRPFNLYYLLEQSQNEKDEIFMMFPNIKFELQSFTNTNFNFLLYRKGYVEYFKQWLGFIKDIKTGDPFFDNRFIIESRNPDFVKRLLTEDFKQTLNLVHPHFKGTMSYNGRIVKYFQLGSLHQEQKIGQLMCMMELAEKIADTVEKI